MENDTTMIFEENLLEQSTTFLKAHPTIGFLGRYSQSIWTSSGDTE
jgi:hypothetical protein